MDNQFNNSQGSTDPYQSNNTYSQPNIPNNYTEQTNQSYNSYSQPQQNSTFAQPNYTATPQYNNQFNTAPVKKPLDVYALISMICGIVSIVLCCCCYIISLICAIAAIVLAIISKNKSETQKFSGMALAGLICGIIGLSLSIIVLIFVVVGNTSDLFDYVKDYIDEL